MARPKNITLTASISGMDKVTAALGGVTPNVITAAMAGVHKQAIDIMEESLLEVPRGTNALADSNYIEDPVLVGDDIVIRFGYGGPNVQINPNTGKPTTDYAVHVHEDLTADHPIGKAKYLEDPFNRATPNILNNLAAYLKDALR